MPDLVIPDLQMPGSPDGPGVRWKLKTDSRFERTRVLILSGQTIKSSRLACESFRADAFLRKTSSPTDLAARVENLLHDESIDESTARKRILIVDDRAELRDLVSLTPGTGKFEFVEADNGQDAPELIADTA